MGELVNILRDAGYEVIEGAETVRSAIGFDYSKERCCSGWGVFPGGEKCPGCGDCIEVDSSSGGNEG